MPESNFTLILTRHAETRMSQRGVRREDIGLILLFGTQIAPDAWLMTRADADREIAALKRTIKQMMHGTTSRSRQWFREISALKHRIQQFERLQKKNLKVVVEGGTVVTCYPSCTADQRRTLRRGQERAA